MQVTDISADNFERVKDCNWVPPYKRFWEDLFSKSNLRTPSSNKTLNKKAAVTIFAN